MTVSLDEMRDEKKTKKRLMASKIQHNAKICVCLPVAAFVFFSPSPSGSELLARRNPKKRIAMVDDASTRSTVFEAAAKIVCARRPDQTGA
jgi:hypothetical protein